MTDVTIRRAPTYHVVSWVTIVCLAGMADLVVDNRGRAIASICERRRFNDLPLGKLINPSER